MDNQIKVQSWAGKEALKKAIAVSIPLFFLNYMILSHVFHSINFAYFLSHFKWAFYILFNIVSDAITFNIVLIELV